MTETTMNDIYEAAGTIIENGVTRFKPFDIVLRVIPTAVEWHIESGERITFRVILADTYVQDNGTIYYTSNEPDLTIPVNQVRIAKDDPKKMPMSEISRRYRELNDEKMRQSEESDG